MASISKRGQFWRAQIRNKGYPSQSRTFDTRAAAEKWARLIESEMDRGIFIDRSEAEQTSLSDALDRYGREVTPTKRGKSQELRRIERWKSCAFASKSIASLRGADFAAFRDERRKLGRAENTIRIELALIGHLYEVARREWRMEGLMNPIRSIRMPKGSNSRERRLNTGEYDKVIQLISAHTVGPWMKAAFILAIETGLRRSALVQLRWDWIDFDKRVVNIPSELREIENKGLPIGIPLWKNTENLLFELPRSIDGRILPISSNALSCAWKRIQKIADLNDLHWHDLRHEATSRLFEKGLNPIEVQSITGHKSMQMLKRYTHIHASDLLRKYS